LILGRQKQVAFSEIFHYFGEGDILFCGEDAVVVSGAEAGESGACFLGGAPKSGILIGSLDRLDAQKVCDFILKFRTEEKKFNFGISFYDLGKKPLDQKQLFAFGLSVKKNLKAKGVSSRYVSSKSGNLSSVDVVKNNLLKDGVELCLLFSEKEILIGKTESVQPYEEYSERDFERPWRDAKRGMIPPKLSRSMINMSCSKKGDLILDPFCGIGTIAQEALLMGFRVIGSDVDERAILGARKNLDWLEKKNLFKKDCLKLLVCDSRKLVEKIEANSIDSVVTEPDLGPPLLGDETDKKILSIERSLFEFYIDSMAGIFSVLKKGGRAVVVFPYFAKKDIFVGNLSEFSGFRVINPYSERFEKKFELSRRKTLVYGREGQSVFREIVIFEKI